MDFMQSILTGLFCIAVVFFVLITLLVIIRVFSAVLKLFEPKEANQQNGQ